MRNQISSNRYTVLLTLLVLVLTACSSSAGLYSQVSALMAVEGERAGIELDLANISYSAIRDNLVVIAPIIRSTPGFSEPGPFAFAYVSFSSIACGVENGFYTLALAQDNDLTPLDQLQPGSSELTVQLVSLEGEVIAEQPFTREVMRMPIDEVPEDEFPLNEVMIQESRLETGATAIIIPVHVKSHHERAGWVWWEWNDGAII